MKSKGKKWRMGFVLAPPLILNYTRRSPESPSDSCSEVGSAFVAHLPPGLLCWDAFLLGTAVKSAYSSYHRLPVSSSQPADSDQLDVDLQNCCSLNDCFLFYAPFCATVCEQISSFWITRSDRFRFLVLMFDVKMNSSYWPVRTWMILCVVLRPRDWLIWIILRIWRVCASYAEEVKTCILECSYWMHHWICQDAMMIKS